MTQKHNEELNRRLTECTGAVLNLGSNKYPTGYHYSRNLQNEDNQILFRNENVSDVYLIGVGTEDYYKYGNTTGDRDRIEKLDDSDVQSVLSKSLTFDCLYLEGYCIDSLQFIRSTVLKDILIKDGSYKSLRLEGSYLLGLCILNTQKLDNVEIKSCEFVSDVLIQANNTEVNISNVSGKRLRITVGGNANNIRIGKDVNFSEGITIVGITDKGSPSIMCLSFESADILADIKVERLTVKNISIAETDFRKQVLFFQIDIFSLSIMNSSFVSPNKGRIVNCNVTESLSLNAVDFGNMSFTNCNFSDLNYLKFTGVNLSDCASVGTSWENELKVIPKDHRYDYFKQVCKVYDLEKNTQKYIEFKALYLEEVRRKVDTNGEKISLALSYYTSEHGTNWWRPMFILLSLALFNFIFINVINYSIQGMDTLNIFSVRDSLILMNPAHLFSHYTFNNAWDGFYLWATFMRIINGYLLFQVVKSFRKFI